MDEQRERALTTALTLAAPRYPVLGMMPTPGVWDTIMEIAQGRTEDVDACVVARELLRDSQRHWGECKV
jgi:hypothetical protein